MIIADTDVLIDALRGRGEAAQRVAQELKSGNLATTSVTAFELVSGARSQTSRDAVEHLLDAVTVFGLEQRAAVAAANLRRELERRGAPIGMADYLIGGICLVHSSVLLTLNRAHFERVSGLRLASLDGPP